MKIALSSEEAGEALGVSADTVRRLVKRGLIARVPGIDKIRISVAELERFANSGRVA